MYKKIRLRSNHYWLLAIAAGAAFSIPSLVQHQSNMNKIRSDIAAREAKAQKLERSLEFEKRQAAVANKRYESCLPVVGEYYRNGTHYFTGLKEGDVPRDRITKQPFSKGTVVCDAHGLTGVINEDGAVINVAYTGDRDLVQKRLQRFRGSQYSQPVLGGQ
ncbi:MAG: hypothetical protein QNJ36_01230 [Calothrix sp. MO_167.B42]|nr:hypothetical protein [Calothrix sp. MO_167.B42]